MWHYRPIKKITKDGFVTWGVVEYYGKKYGMTPPCSPTGETKEELIRDVKLMLMDIQTRRTIVRRE